MAYPLSQDKILLGCIAVMGRSPSPEEYKLLYADTSITSTDILIQGLVTLPEYTRMGLSTT